MLLFRCVRPRQRSAVARIELTVAGVTVRLGRHRGATRRCLQRRLPRRQRLPPVGGKGGSTPGPTVGPTNGWAEATRRIKRPIWRHGTIAQSLAMMASRDRAMSGPLIIPLAMAAMFTAG